MAKLDAKELPYIALIVVLLGAVVILGSTVNFLSDPTGKFVKSSLVIEQVTAEQTPEPLGNTTLKGKCFGPFCIRLSIFPFDRCNLTMPIIPPILGLSSDCYNTTQATHAACVFGQCVEVVGPGSNDCTLNAACVITDEDKALENAVAFALWVVEAQSITINDEDISSGYMIMQNDSNDSIESGKLFIRGAGRSVQDYR